MGSTLRSRSRWPVYGGCFTGKAKGPKSDEGINGSDQQSDPSSGNGQCGSLGIRSQRTPSQKESSPHVRISSPIFPKSAPAPARTEIPVVKTCPNSNVAGVTVDERYTSKVHTADVEGKQGKRLEHVALTQDSLSAPGLGPAGGLGNLSAAGPLPVHFSFTSGSKNVANSFSPMSQVLPM